MNNFAKVLKNNFKAIDKATGITDNFAVVKLKSGITTVFYGSTRKVNAFIKAPYKLAALNNSYNLVRAPTTNEDTAFKTDVIKYGTKSPSVIHNAIKKAVKKLNKNGGEILKLSATDKDMIKDKRPMCPCGCGERMEYLRLCCKKGHEGLQAM